MSKQKLTIAAAAALLLTGCGADSVPETDIITTEPVPAAEIVQEMPAETEADDTFRASQYAFALELMKRTSQNNGCDNTMVSPYSVIEALGMTMNGAAGQTRAEMEQVLGGGIPCSELDNYLYTWRIRQPDTKTCKLNTANGIWINDTANFEVNPDFLQMNSHYFGAEVQKTPFDAGTAGEINNWVKKNTDGMIPSIIDQLDPLDRMVLVNAVCFDAKWKVPYESENIKKNRTFTNADGSESKVQMLYSDEAVYLKQDGATGFFREYDGPYAFVGILPPEDVTLDDWLSDLDADDLQSMIDNRKTAEVRAGIPEFTYDTSLQLRNTLCEMGMPTAFSEENADFSGISDTFLSIAQVIHKTHIELDADGTKAAAATAVTMRTNCIAAAPEKKFVILNRPFLYLILDTQNDLPVFIGTVENL